MRKSEKRYRTLIDTIPQLVWVANSNGIDKTTHNQQWFDFTGQTPQEAQATGWLQVVHPDDIPLVLSRWVQTKLSKSSYETELRLRRRDGEYVWHLSKAKAVFNDFGQIENWYGTCTDISLRKQSEELRDQQIEELQRLDAL